MIGYKQQQSAAVALPEMLGLVWLRMNEELFPDGGQLPQHPPLLRVQALVVEQVGHHEPFTQPKVLILLLLLNVGDFWHGGKEEYSMIFIFLARNLSVINTGTS